MKIDNFQSQVCVCAASTNLTCAKGRAEMGLKMIYARYVKRILDIILSLSAIIALSPLLLILYLLVRVKLGSPVSAGTSGQER